MERKTVSGIMLTLLIFCILNVNMIGITVAQADHDIAVVSVTPSLTSVRVGELVNVTVVVENKGTNNEIFDVTVYYDSNTIKTETVTNLVAGASTSLTFSWNTTGTGEEVYATAEKQKTYTLNATASTVPGETDTADNTLVSDSTVTIKSQYIAIAPDTISDPTLTAGKNFTISIITDYNGSDIWGYQFTLEYNPSVIHGVSVINGDLITNATFPPFPPPPARFSEGEFDNTLGKLSLTVAYFDPSYSTPPPTTSGPGTLANVTFEVVGVGTTNITFGKVETQLKAPSTNIVDLITPYFNHIGDGYFDNTGLLLEPPVAVISAPSTEEIDVDVTFDGSGSSDPDGTIVSYGWDFGDGDTGTGVSVTHAYATADTYTVTLIVTDNDDLTDIATHSITITTELEPPVAVISAPSTALVGDVVTFDGSGSSDPDGTIVSYGWDFGDTSTDTGVSVIHAYAERGVKFVTLMVTDDDGLTDTETHTITITALEPHTISVVPGTISDPTLTVGENFTVDIYSDYTGSDIHKYYFTLTYDPDVIRGGLKGYDTWVADGTTTEWDTTYQLHYGSEEVYVNSLLKTPIMQGNDSWVGDGIDTKFITSESPLVQYSEEVRVDSVLKTRKASKVDTWTGDGVQTVFTTTNTPIKPDSELSKVWLNVTDTWTGDGTTTMFNTTYTPIIYFTEIVRLDGVLQTNGVDYTINYYTGAITFTVAPSNGEEVKVQYKIRLEKPADYTINYDTGVITFAVAPLTGEDVSVSYQYGHYEETYTNGTIRFFSNTVPGVGSAIEVTYLYPVYTIEHHLHAYTLVFEHAPALNDIIEIEYLYGGVTNGDLITPWDGSSGYLEVFNPGRHNITEGKLLLTWAKTGGGFTETGPGILASVTFQVVGIGSSNITLGVETRLENIIGVIPTDQLEHGYFSNTQPPLPTITATANIRPDRLSLRNKGQWIKAYIKLPEGYDVGDIDVSTILLNNEVPAQHSKVCGNRLKARFDRSSVIALLPQVGEVEVTVTGKLFDGTPFEGSDTIRVR